MTTATHSATAPALAPLENLVGEWETEMTHVSFPDLTIHGKATFEWLEGGHFLLQRAQTDHPDFPDSLAIIGEPSMELAGRSHIPLTVQYFDSRGVHRILQG